MLFISLWCTDCFDVEVCTHLAKNMWTLMTIDLHTDFSLLENGSNTNYYLIYGKYTVYGHLKLNNC